jgi:hypothetical protein
MCFVLILSKRGAGPRSDSAFRNNMMKSESSLLHLLGSILFHTLQTLSFNIVSNSYSLVAIIYFTGPFLYKGFEFVTCGM